MLETGDFGGAGWRVTWENLGGVLGSEPGPQRAGASDTG